MELEPFDWNVVIVAYWNRAIFTPSGIAKRLFNIPVGTGMEVFVPMDLLESPMVKYEGTMVRVEDRRLVVGATKGSYDALGKAMEMGRNALASLPDTPVLAAGFNVRFKAVGDYSEIENLAASARLDGCLSDVGYEIIGKSLTRIIRCRNMALEKGIVTLSLDVQEERAKIELNFNRDSRDSKELIEWLNVATTDVEKAVNDILASCGCTEDQEVKHV